MSKFNFINITLQKKADITDVMDNFNKIELEAITESDLAKVYNITIDERYWVQTGDVYEYTISNKGIENEPYIIDIIFNDLTIIKSPIYPKPNSQSKGSVQILTKSKPTQNLAAILVVTKGVK